MKIYKLKEGSTKKLYQLTALLFFSMILVFTGISTETNAEVQKTKRLMIEGLFNGKDNVDGSGTEAKNIAVEVLKEKGIIR